MSSKNLKKKKKAKIIRKSKNQVVHEQKLETSGSILNKGNILLMDFFLFSRSRVSDVDIGSIVTLFNYEKLE